MSDEQPLNAHDRLAAMKGFKIRKQPLKVIKIGDKVMCKGTPYQVISDNGNPKLVRTVIKRVEGDG